jgi:hypothetical protein
MGANRIRLFCVLIIGAVAGMLPFAAFLETRPIDDPFAHVFAGVYLLGAVLITVVRSIRHSAAENEPPSRAEFVHATAGGAAYSASASFFGFMLYGTAYAGLAALTFIADKFGWIITLNADIFARWASGPITLLFGLLALLLSPIPRTLYPELVGVVSAYAPLLKRGMLWLVILLGVGGVALALGTYFMSAPSVWWYVLAVFMIVAAGSDSMSAATQWSPTAALGQDAVKALQKLYGALGYTTVTSPRTKDANADVDSLLQRVDIFASDESNAFAIELKTQVRTGKAVSAADASLLPIAARVVSRYLNSNEGSQTEQPPVVVHPVLVLVGREATADLAHLAEEEGMRVLSFTEESLRAVLQSDDENSLRELARTHLLGDEAGTRAAPLQVAAAAASASL